MLVKVHYLIHLQRLVQNQQTIHLEAMNARVPVVISKQSGVAEVLRYAIKVDFWDIDAMANAIYSLLNYPALSKMFVKYGKKEVQSIRWEDAANQLRNVYYKLLS